jgi:hypothetical protein
LERGETELNGKNEDIRNSLIMFRTGKVNKKIPNKMQRRPKKNKLRDMARKMFSRLLKIYNSAPLIFLNSKSKFFQKSCKALLFFE